MASNSGNKHLYCLGLENSPHSAAQTWWRQLVKSAVLRQARAPDGGFQIEIKVSICAFINLALKSVGTLVSSGKKKAILFEMRLTNIERNQKIKELLICILSLEIKLSTEK